MKCDLLEVFVNEYFLRFFFIIFDIVIFGKSIIFKCSSL